MQLVLHAPFGARINRAWGLALRKRFCRSFNFELQAAATDNGIVISLTEQHAFPLEIVFEFVKSASVEHVLTQALLDAPMFGARWRWNATRALAILRMRGGKKVAPQLQRMRADDLLAAVFPDQAACAENLTGPIRIPDHPLVRETIDNCLHEAMDLDGLHRRAAGASKRGDDPNASPSTRPSRRRSATRSSTRIRTRILDDAPLEERRARAVQLRRTLRDRRRRRGHPRSGRHRRGRRAVVARRARCRRIARRAAHARSCCRRCRSGSAGSRNWPLQRRATR